MSKPIRVLQVYAQMNRGGAETMIMNLYRNIDRSKIQFDFIVHTEDKCDYDEEIRCLGGTIHRIPRYTGRNHFQYNKAWFDFFRFHPEYKIIHGHVRSTASIYLKIAKKQGLTTIAHSHSTSSGSGLSALTKNILQYPIRYTAEYLIACSKYAGEWLYGKGACKSDRFFIFKNAIETKKFLFNKETRIKKAEELNIKNKFVVGHIGRFNTPKNHSFLIDIFKSVHEKNKNSLLLLVGDGDLRTEIEKKVNSLGLNNSVVFTGVRSDISDLLQVMDVLVFPSLYEGLPVTLIEAQASGLPCIISDNISEEVKITELVRFISINKSASIWANEVVKYSNKPERRNTYQDIVKEGYDIEMVVREYQQFYITCCKSK